MVWICLAYGARHWARQHGGDDPKPAIPAQRHGLLSATGYVRHTWRRGQHYRRQPRPPDKDPRPARGRGRGLVFRLGRRRSLRGVRIRCQHEVDMGRLKPAPRLAGSRAVAKTTSSCTKRRR